MFSSSIEFWNIDLKYASSIGRCRSMVVLSFRIFEVWGNDLRWA